MTLNKSVGLGAGSATAEQEAYCHILDGIRSGRFGPGDRLIPEVLAAGLGMSRMPVREALRQLEAQALIDFVPHKGAVVTEISASDAADTYAIRLALEPAAFALSIPHLNDEDFSRAADLIAEMDAEPDPSRMGELNRRFHMSLYARAGVKGIQYRPTTYWQSLWVAGSTPGSSSVQFFCVVTSRQE